MRRANVEYIVNHLNIINLTNVDSNVDSSEDNKLEYIKDLIEQGGLDKAVFIKLTRSNKNNNYYGNNQLLKKLIGIYSDYISQIYILNEYQTDEFSALNNKISNIEHSLSVLFSIQTINSWNNFISQIGPQDLDVFYNDNEASYEFYNMITILNSCAESLDGFNDFHAIQQIIDLNLIDLLLEVLTTWSHNALSANARLIILGYNFNSKQQFYQLHALLSLFNHKNVPVNFLNNINFNGKTLINWIVTTFDDKESLALFKLLKASNYPEILLSSDLLGNYIFNHSAKYKDSLSYLTINNIHRLRSLAVFQNYSNFDGSIVSEFAFDLLIKCGHRLNSEFLNYLIDNNLLTINSFNHINISTRLGYNNDIIIKLVEHNLIDVNLLFDAIIYAIPNYYRMKTLIASIELFERKNFISIYQYSSSYQSNLLNTAVKSVRAELVNYLINVRSLPLIDFNLKSQPFRTSSRDIVTQLSENQVLGTMFGQSFSSYKISRLAIIDLFKNRLSYLARCKFILNIRCKALSVRTLPEDNFVIISKFLGETPMVEEDLQSPAPKRKLSRAPSAPKRFKL